MITLATGGKFTWGFGRTFHIETSEGNYEWSDPGYGGDNTISHCSNYGDWLKENNIPFGRDKGQHTIGDYCGPDVIIKEEK